MSNRNITRWVESEIHLSAYELAEIFWAMDAEEQASFFHRLGEVSGPNLGFQLQSVTDSKHTTPLGRSVMEMIGDYSPESCKSKVATLAGAVA